MKRNNELLLLLSSYFIMCITLGMSEDVSYDLCIIGAGMFGSAAAKYASANPSLKVCLIGPDEPIGDEWEHREIFASHYDESRLVDTIEPEAEIQILARESIKRYRELEKLSGISFYYPVGLLSIGRKQSHWMEQSQRGAAKRVKDCVLDLTKRSVFDKRFPFMKIEEDEYAIFDDTGAGYINPRKMIEAQTKVAKMQGCTLITDVVYEVSDEKDGYHEIFIENGTRVKAKRVLITTGAYTNFKKFDPLPKLQLTPIKETVAMIQIPQDEAQRLSSMPGLIYKKEDADIMAYILPPVLYPDGFYYLKLGPLNVDFKNQALYNLKSMKSWYLSDGDQTMVKKISKLLINMLPGLKVENIASATGVTCATVSTLPYIDRILPTVTVATGGNGRGAKICEEVGRIAAHLSLTGQWSSEISQRLFNAIPI